MKLTPRQQRFVDAYQGNAAEVARVAGLGAPETCGPRLLRNAHVRAAIAAREAAPRALVIATREERQAFWTKTAQDPEVAWGDRLRASELLGKSQADFVERHEHKIDSATLEQLLGGDTK